MGNKEIEIDYLLWQLSDLIEIINDGDLIERLYIFKHEILDLKFGGNDELFI